MSVLNIYSLPDMLLSRLHTTTVSVTENNGGVFIEPVIREKNKRKLRGMFSDGKLSVDKHLEMMRKDKETFEK
jgi:hypothetical protein